MKILNSKQNYYKDSDLSDIYNKINNFYENEFE